MIPSAFAGSPGPAAQTDPRRIATMQQRAQELEAVFLSEMLGHAGMGAMKGPFGGGNGEDQFSSFLRNEQAKAMVARGGIGLSEVLFQAMQKADGNAV